MSSTGSDCRSAGDTHWFLAPSLQGSRAIAKSAVSALDEWPPGVAAGQERTAWTRANACCAPWAQLLQTQPRSRSAADRAHVARRALDLQQCAALRVALTADE